ncbi:MAG TPA: hypothetical protein PLR32_07410 [candidate division Zixibacteria bacterium]|nr:hypothetical protein [candidate division Zixibacteria bacterium]MDD4918659.1 hypothetical protein [candidate division Zixibacteria bacterium]MDM7971727.1 hypothetical protein [candidate division Zixibacteria bacterium]HOD67000.1 hypothetical protein [candidate division Zixibacteria bacterium]HPI33128.1 hypothetical protein [candidate division Zixibacteria bacterium]
MKLESRHWIFLGLGAAVVAAMALQVNLQVPASDDTLGMHRFIEEVPAGSTIIVSFDHEASSLPEIRPLALAVLRHAFSRNLKIVGTALLAEGTGVGYRLVQQTAREYDKRYGEDWVYLGFKPQYIAAILSMGESFAKTWPEDYLGRPYTDLPMLAEIETYGQIAGVVSVADGSLTTHWIEYAASRYRVRVAAAVTAAMVTTYDPYLASGQLQAMVGGLRGAAEYEQLIARGGGGERGMLAQTVSHLYVVALIVVGNLVFFATRRREKGGGG